ncbi:MAG: NERD domain-containing protein [Oscillospiraceae bacterium]|nr:NERD domain-containing protein [Oscillospiraceae bacterium]
MWLFIIIILVLAAIGIYLKSPSVKGRRSEQAVARRLEIDSILKRGGKTLTNIYIPKESGDTSEIDVLYVTQKGLLVLENKNYAGYIFGSEQNKSWTVTLYAGKSWHGGKRTEKHQFYNPIWQNRTHIKNLQSLLNLDIRAFSLITFSDRGDLKDITVNSSNVYVCNHSELSRVLREIWNENEDVLNEDQIEAIYKKLLPLTNADKAAKKKHVSDIQDRFSSTDICPVCGGKLVLRTAKKGPNTGNQFYGCSNYPKCKYTKNI